jgi:hypothetical protein
MENLSAVRLAYCAGLIDGEAYIGAIRRMPSQANKLSSPKYSIRISLCMADEEPVRFVADTIDAGHKVYLRDRKVKAHHSPMWNLDLESARAAGLLVLVLPYLICKRTQAENAMKLHQLRSESLQHRNTLNAAGTATRMDRAYLERCDALYLVMRRRAVANNGMVARALS